LRNNLYGAARRTIFGKLTVLYNTLKSVNLNRHSNNLDNLIYIREEERALSESYRYTVCPPAARTIYYYARQYNIVATYTKL